MITTRDYERQVKETWRRFELGTDRMAEMRELVHYATLAANGHNAQAWKFVLCEAGIEMIPDFGRRLAVVDPHDRELWISLGCALENLLVAARAVGYMPEVAYPDGSDRIRIRLTEGAPRRDPLFDAILQRQNTRSAFDGRALPPEHLAQLQGLRLEPGVQLRWITGQSEMERIGAFVAQGSLVQYGNPAFVGELLAWLRFNQAEALGSLDGLYGRCVGSPDAPRWVGRLFVTGTRPAQQAAADVRKLRSSAGAVVVASETDDRLAWVRVGQVYERLALQMTALHIQSALLNQPVEVETLRPQFQQALGLGSIWPQMVVRFGYADRRPKALRRPVRDVLAWPTG